MFSPELRERVRAGDITVSIRLWQRPKVKTGGRYASHGFAIEVDSVELLPFSAVTAEDVARSGEGDREMLRRRAAHAGPIEENTLVYRVEFHVVREMPERYGDGVVPAAAESGADGRARPGLDPSESPNGSFVFTIDLDGEQFAVYQSGPGDWGYEWLTGPNDGYGFGASGRPIDSLEEHRQRIREFLRDIDPATGFIRDD